LNQWSEVVSERVTSDSRRDLALKPQGTNASGETSTMTVTVSRRMGQLVTENCERLDSIINHRADADFMVTIA
jgi:hypothetical protein